MMTISEYIKQPWVTLKIKVKELELAANALRLDSEPPENLLSLSDIKKNKHNIPTVYISYGDGRVKRLSNQSSPTGWFNGYGQHVGYVFAGESMILYLDEYGKRWWAYKNDN